ncbi:MAG: hypothetical protein JEZ08_05155 [Clostridiales bacterium]|nr:hypothetical protein [Clostridiales bacterium]
MGAEIGERIGSIIYYIVEVGVYLLIAYCCLLKPEQSVRRVFKKYNKKLQYLSYFFGVIAIFQVITSISEMLQETIL